jgi:hypothetical protein
MVAGCHLGLSADCCHRAVVEMLSFYGTVDNPSRGVYTQSDPATIGGELTVLYYLQNHCKINAFYIAVGAGVYLICCAMMIEIKYIYEKIAIKLLFYAPQF